jgi:hypothetical protein
MTIVIIRNKKAEGDVPVANVAPIIKNEHIANVTHNVKDALIANVVANRIWGLLEKSKV